MSQTLTFVVLIIEIEAFKNKIKRVLHARRCLISSFVVSLSPECIIEHHGM